MRSSRLSNVQHVLRAPPRSPKYYTVMADVLSLQGMEQQTEDKLPGKSTVKGSYSNDSHFDYAICIVCFTEIADSSVGASQRPAPTAADESKDHVTLPDIQKRGIYRANP